MSETDWMYESLTERFGETLGDRQKVVDALLIAKAVVGPGTLGAGNPEGVISIARFILDEWGKYSDAEDDEDAGEEVSGAPHVLDVGVITEYDIKLLRSGDYAFPEGSRWRNYHGFELIFTGGEFFLGASRLGANTYPDSLPFIRIKEEN